MRRSVDIYYYDYDYDYDYDYYYTAAIRISRDNDNRSLRAAQRGSLHKSDAFFSSSASSSFSFICLSSQHAR